MYRCGLLAWRLRSAWKPTLPIELLKQVSPPAAALQGWAELIERSTK